MAFFSTYPDVTGEFVIDYVNQRIYHANTTNTYTVNQFYSALTLEFDEAIQMDDLPPMSAQTPTAFTMENGWFIDPISLRFLYGGSLATLGWSSSTYDNGIRVLTFGGTYTSAVAGDIGKPVVYNGGSPAHTGTLLYYDNTLKKWWVRTNLTTDTFANTVTAVEITGGTGTGVLSTASTTGENTWANVFTLGTLASNTQIYLYQDDAQISPWWSTGHIDVLILVKEAGTLIDYGYVTIFVRQYSKLFDHYAADLSAGARTPIPLATFDDSNNTTGYRQMVLTDASAAFTVGEIIQDNSDATIQGIITSSTGTAPNVTIQYYLYNATQTDFSVATGAFTGATSSSTGTAVNPTNVGPAGLASPISITFGATSEDLNNGNGSRPYDVIVDCNNNTLSNVYEYLKYVTRYGNTSTLNGHSGESYTAVGDIRLNYDNEASGPFTEGETVTGTGVSGVIVSLIDNGLTGTMVLRDVVGTFGDNIALTGGSSGATCDTVGTAETISPNKQAPFGSFAGGKFFGARGVWLTNVPTGDANNYQLIDATNTAQIPPQSITLTVNGIIAGDQVAVFRATGDNNIVNKSMYNVYNAHTTAPATAVIRITEAIPNDTPTAGSIRVVRRNAAGTILGEERYTYTTFSNANQPTYSQFNLSGNITTTYGTDDTVYVPYIDTTAGSTSESVALIYTAPRYITARVRKSGILPFMIKSSISNSNLTITAVRATDSIA